MKLNFTIPECAFITDGGNLWWIAERVPGCWAIFRQSLSGGRQIGHDHESYAEAYRGLTATIQTSSRRTVSALHHTVPLFDHMRWCA